MEERNTQREKGFNNVDSELGFKKRIVAIDYFKHLATMSAGAIALIAAFLRSLIELGSHTGLLSFAASAFFICIIASAMAGFLLLTTIESVANIIGSSRHLATNISVFFAILGFVAGLFGLFIFILSSVP